MTEKEWLAINPIRRWRESQAPPWSGADLARFLSVTKMTVSYWERGKSYPNAITFAAITALTQVSVAELMHWRSLKPRKPQE